MGADSAAGAVPEAAGPEVGDAAAGAAAAALAAGAVGAVGAAGAAGCEGSCLFVSGAAVVADGGLAGVAGEAGC